MSAVAVCVRANSPVATVQPYVGLRSLSCGRFYIRRLYRGARPGHRRRHYNDALSLHQVKTIHIERLQDLSVFQSSDILPHRNISCRSSETGQVFRTMNTV